jgi:regulator of CtrA degradation
MPVSASGVAPAARHQRPVSDEDLASVQARCEALRTTTRIMHCLAWLLNRRAWFAGELTEQQLRRHGRLIAHFPASDPAAVAVFACRPAGRPCQRTPLRTHRPSRRSLAALARPSPEQAGASPTITRLRERLVQAMARAG